MAFTLFLVCLKKNLNASRPSERSVVSEIIYLPDLIGVWSTQIIYSKLCATHVDVVARDNSLEHMARKIKYVVPPPLLRQCSGLVQLCYEGAIRFTIRFAPGVQLVTSKPSDLGT